MNHALKIIGLIIGGPIAVVMVLAAISGVVVIASAIKKANRPPEEAWIQNVRSLPTFDECNRDARGYGATYRAAYDICHKR
jgi:hypothetical protein